MRRDALCKIRNYQEASRNRTEIIASEDLNACGKWNKNETESGNEQPQSYHQCLSLHWENDAVCVRGQRRIAETRVQNYNTRSTLYTSRSSQAWARRSANLTQSRSHARFFLINLPPLCIFSPMLSLVFSAAWGLPNPAANICAYYSPPSSHTPHRDSFISQEKCKSPAKSSLRSHLSGASD